MVMAVLVVVERIKVAWGLMHVDVEGGLMLVMMMVCRSNCK
jgi:hypothetical protein